MVVPEPDRERERGTATPTPLPTSTTTSTLQNATTTTTPTLHIAAMTRRRAATTAFELGGEDNDKTEAEDEGFSDTGGEGSGALNEDERLSDMGHERMSLDEDESLPRTSLEESPPLEDDEVAGVTLDDDDFESHYSRHESEESDEEEELGGEGEDTDDDEQQQQQQQGQQNRNAGPGGYFPSSSSQRPDALSRVRSLPARPVRAKGRPKSQNHGGLHTSQSTTSLPPPPPPPLYPPFYNRPPTPLPPSPSLTSLLRPPSLLNRSTASTRPTTPDSSDVETPNDTEAAVAHSARRANPLPPTSPKVPTYEYYGFVLYLASSIAFLMYVLWSYLPSPFLHALGITYYPNRWWSLAIPAWIVMLLVYIYVALLSYNVEYLTLPLNSLECMVDEAANVAILDESGRVRKGGSKRLVKELEERERFERQMESAKANANVNAGKARRYCKGEGGASSNFKSKGKSSRKASESTVRSEPPQVPVREYQPPLSRINPTAAAHSAHHGSLGHAYYGATFPFVSNLDARGSQYAGAYPNWKLVWNEGTDAVMDIPIGGVCEVLYG